MTTKVLAGLGAFVMLSICGCSEDVSGTSAGSGVSDVKDAPEPSVPAEPELSGDAAAEESSSPPAPVYTVADYDPKRDPASDLNDATKRATADGKRILLEIGGHW